MIWVDVGRWKEGTGADSGAGAGTGTGTRSPVVGWVVGEVADLFRRGRPRTVTVRKRTVYCYSYVLGGNSIR